jgi:2'-5' RNA ligase
MHVTLRFLGEVEERVARELQARLAQPFHTAAFRLTVSGVGAFPPSGPPRVFWIGITEGADRLVELHDEVERRLDGLGFEREDRPYRAHLTLARVKGRLGADARRLLAAIPPEEFGSVTVSRVTLFESRLSSRGAVHTPLAHGPLREA